MIDMFPISYAACSMCHIQSNVSSVYRLSKYINFVLSIFDSNQYRQCLKSKCNVSRIWDRDPFIIHDSSFSSKLIMSPVHLSTIINYIIFTCPSPSVCVFRPPLLLTQDTAGQIGGTVIFPRHTNDQPLQPLKDANRPK